MSRSTTSQLTVAYVAIKLSVIVTHVARAFRSAYNG